MYLTVHYMPLHLLYFQVQYMKPFIAPAMAVGGASSADDAMFDIAMPLFETDDVQWGLKSAVDALKAGKPRPVLQFKGR